VESKGKGISQEANNNYKSCVDNKFTITKN